MLDDDVSEPEVLRQARQQQAQRFETTGRRADADDEGSFIDSHQVRVIVGGNRRLLRARALLPGLFFVGDAHRGVSDLSVAVRQRSMKGPDVDSWSRRRVPCCPG